MSNARQIELLPNGWRRITLPNGKIVEIPPPPEPIIRVIEEDNK